MGAVLPAVALYVFVSMFSDGEESSARWKILFIAIGSAIVSAVFHTLIPGIAGSLLGFAAALLLIAAALVFWVKVSRKAALKIAGAYAAFSVALTILYIVLLGQVT